MKKCTALIAVSLLLTGAKTKAPYYDIEQHWAQKYIEQMSEDKFLLGYTDGTFRPDNDILNVETYSIINKIFKFDSYSESSSSIPNTMSTQWYYNDLLAAESGGYVSFNRSFKVEPITRLEVCSILGKLYDLSNDESQTNLFNDISSLKPEEINSISALAKDGIVKGFGDNTFRPSENITRAQLSKILMLSMDKYGRNLRKFDSSKQEIISKLLEKLSDTNTKNLNSTDIQKLNYIISQISEKNYIASTEMDTWISFLNGIVNTDKIVSPTNPPITNSKYYLNIKVTDSNGNPISATVKLNNNVFDGRKVEKGKYLLKIESPGKQAYESFIEITSDQTLNIALEDAKQSYLKLTLNSQSLSSSAGTEFKSGARVTININIPNGMEVDYLLVNGTKKGVLSDEFTFIITQDTQIDVAFKPEENS